MNENKKHFTPEEIGKMTTEEFKANEPTIMEQIRTGNIGKPSDNIDVTGCELGRPVESGKIYCQASSTKNNNHRYVYCKDNPNCYYRQALNKQKTVNEVTMQLVQLEEQLQQKERDIENYKRKIELFKDLRADETERVVGLMGKIEAKDAEIKELKKELKLAYCGENAAMHHANNLQSNLNKAIEGLENICNPLKYLKKVAEKSGAMLNSGAVQLANDSTLLKEIATQTLEEVRGKR